MPRSSSCLAPGRGGVNGGLAEVSEDEEDAGADTAGPAKSTHRTEVHWEINTEEIEPFLYFDASTPVPACFPHSSALPPDVLGAPR